MKLIKIEKKEEKVTTNVSASDLNYNQYETDQYDREIHRAIPGYEKLHVAIREAVLNQFAGRRGIKVLDLGCGTGNTSVLVNSILPKAQFTLVDFSEQMLNGARSKLGDSAEYILGDYSQVDFGGPYDLVISVIGFHHQDHVGKRKMFRRIYEAMNPGGLFLLGDLMTYQNFKDAALNHALHYHHMVEKAEGDRRLLAEWSHHHMYLNDLAPATSQVEWLGAVGFESELKFFYMNTGLILARKNYDD